MGSVPARRLILAAAAAGLLLRLAFGLLYWTGKPLTHDEHEYMALAASLRAGHGFRYPPTHESGTAPQFGRAPGYPAFLALVGVDGTANETPAVVKVTQSVLGAVGVWMIGLIARRAAGDRAGVVAAGIAAVYPPLVWLPSYTFSESLYIPIAFASVMTLEAAWRAADRHGSARGGGAAALVAGLFAGAAILVRPGMLFFLPIAAIWLVVRRRWTLALALCVGAAAVVTPWTLRNVRQYDRVVLVGSEGGVTFWTGNHRLSRGEGDLAANPGIKRAELEFRAAHPGLDAEAMEPLYYRDALSTIAADPVWWVGLLARKAFYTVVPIGPSYTLHSTKYAMASVISYGLIAPLGVVGLFRLGGRGGATPLLLLALSVVATTLVFFPQERFRIPVIDPALIVGASVTLTGALRRR